MRTVGSLILSPLSLTNHRLRFPCHRCGKTYCEDCIKGLGDCTVCEDCEEVVCETCIGSHDCESDQTSQ
jgi:hypothetical protein